MTAVGVACGSCGTALRDHAKFCDECGTTVSSSGPQYKQVTVLFADVVRSMDIAATVEIERLREIMTDLLERSAAVVRRYGGTVEYNGDGVMALFGAPVALEDHAFRACLAALEIQDEANRLATEVHRRDGVTLRLRVGLDSGQVIAGEIGSGVLGYAATGTHVGMAQRLESAAPPGAVMLSESTARLVEDSTELAEPELLHIKGSADPVRARRLVAIGPRGRRVGRAEANLVGRRWEMAALDALLDCAIGGRGGVVNVVGPPGVGKSRVAREAAALAASRGVEVFWTFCESHARDVPFHAVTHLLRAGSGVADLQGQAARDRAREVVPDADAQDLLVLDDLLGIADPEVPTPQIDPEARRRRLTALVNAASLARAEPALHVIEDAHWIDPVSESMIADLLTVIPRTKLVVLITARPEYDGALTRAQVAQTIALAPLNDSDTTTLIGELLGSDPSVEELGAIIAERAAGNPFFAEEMVRELEQRGVLAGAHGGYLCQTDVADVNVPATVQATIAARIDRLDTAAKQTLSAASVIGARFGADLLAALGIEPVVDDLLHAELIDQVRFTPTAEYAFCHPLIRAVAYESQLKSDRAQWHRRLAAVIQDRAPGSVDENAALIAEHLESAGDLAEAYSWQMRAAGWSANRDVGAARTAWERARRIADKLPVADSSRLSMRIAPSTMLCATDWQARIGGVNRGRFAALEEMCEAAGDKVSLAVGMTGLATEILYAGRSQPSRLASEQMSLLESVGDNTLTVGLAAPAFAIWFSSGDYGEILRWSQTVVELAGGDPAMGAGFGIGSPLAATLAWRSVAQWWRGHPGWRQTIDDAVTMAQDSRDAATLAGVVGWTYGLGIQFGTLVVDDSVVHTIEKAVQLAGRASSDLVLSLAEYTLSVALLNSNAVADRSRGLELMLPFRELCLREGVQFLVPVAELWIARESARRGDLDGAVSAMRNSVDEMRQAEALSYGVWGTDLLAETLLELGGEDDLAEAGQQAEWLADLGVLQESAIIDITVLRLRTLLARTRGDDVAFRDLLCRYRSMARSLGFDGHIVWSEAI